MSLDMQVPPVILPVSNFFSIIICFFYALLVLEFHLASMELSLSEISYFLISLFEKNYLSLSINSFGKIIYVTNSFNESNFHLDKKIFSFTIDQWIMLIIFRLKHIFWKIRYLGLVCCFSSDVIGISCHCLSFIYY